jgi:hypothetical protein
MKKPQPNTINFRRPYAKHTELTFTGILTIKNENQEVVYHEPAFRNYVYEFIQQMKKEGATTGGTYSMNGDIDMKITGERRTFYVEYKVGPEIGSKENNLNPAFAKFIVTQKLNKPNSNVDL